jgi:hypothetical protein
VARLADLEGGSRRSSRPAVDGTVPATRHHGAGKGGHNGAVSRATAIAERAGSQDPSLRHIEYIRMFANVAQVQFRAVLDALNKHLSPAR